MLDILDRHIGKLEFIGHPENSLVDGTSCKTYPKKSSCVNVEVSTVLQSRR